MSARSVLEQPRLNRVVAMLFVMSFVAVGVAPNGAAAQTEMAPVTSIRFCHNPPGNEGKYNNLETSVNAFFNAGHPNHEMDIVPPFTYLTQPGDQLNNFAGMNWTPENQLIWESDCGEVPMVELIPVVPTIMVVQASCVNNNIPTVTGGPTAGISYVVNPAPAPATQVQVTAAINPDTHEWGAVGPEWTIVENVATTTVTLNAAEDCSEVTPSPTPTEPAPTPTDQPGDPTPVPTDAPKTDPTTTPKVEPPTPPKAGAVVQLPDTGTGHGSSSVLLLGVTVIVAGALIAAGFRNTSRS